MGKSVGKSVNKSAGPLRHATLIVPDLVRMESAYAGLGLLPCARWQVSVPQAAAWGQPQLGGLRVLELGPTATGPSLLRCIELVGAPVRPTRLSHGWMALEILVLDVDALAARLVAQLAPDAFTVVGAPADLDVSPNIRAMQVIGPAGEMLYLTQIKAPVPPFEVPLSTPWRYQGGIGPLFIAVMSTPSRAAALQTCAPLLPKAQLQFETKVTVLNRALGRALDHRWNVATVQFAGECLFEIDEVIDAQVTTPITGELPSGLAWISMDAAGHDETPTLFEISPGAWVERLPFHVGRNNVRARSGTN